ncbi:YncE family protein [Clostridium sp. CTA-19]
MSYLYICNSTRDRIDKININNFTVEDSIELNYHEKIKPFKLCLYDKTFIISSFENNRIYLLKNDGGIEEFYIGSGCSHMDLIGRQLYIVCEESNTIVCFDVLSKEIVEVISCGISPHSLDFSPDNNSIVIANTLSNDISIIDLKEKEKIKNIKVGNYPVKAVWYENGEKILVCESNMGEETKGELKVISLKYNERNSITIGNIPIDMCCYNNYCYISNLGDGTITIVDITKLEKVDEIEVGGVLKDIIVDEKNIYVEDIYYNQLIQINKISKNKKIIPLDFEPKGMIKI